MTSLRFPILLAAALAAGCAARSQPAADPGPLTHPEPGETPAASVPTVAAAPAPGAVMTGRATYYSDRLAGRRTASGEPYDPAKLTAAHRALPLGTEVIVSRGDGRNVRVRVNDRGPFGRAAARGVIIDVSRRAAEQLGMIRAGVVDVTVRVVREAPPRRPKSRSGSGIYTEGTESMARRTRRDF